MAAGMLIALAVIGLDGIRVWTCIGPDRMLS
jgi:hypothetical protein